jgi:BirA family biotin operon repressor/biotin-[acetyl-CoA-carboxylase] ligase
MLDSTGSTNDDARALAVAGAPHGTAVAAREQTAGRGRRGHSWSSPRGSLYLSVVLRPAVPMQQFVGLAGVCSLGVLHALRDGLGVAAAALKWPNDVILGSGKLAGILVEAGAGAAGVYAVCGLGLNVAPAGEDGAGVERPDGLALPRACLADAGVLVADEGLEQLALLVRDHVVDAVDAWAADVAAGRALAGPLAPVLNEYFDAVPLLGHQVTVMGPAGESLGEGVFAGIDAWGRATVHTADGRDVEYAAEQASLRPRL